MNRILAIDFGEVRVGLALSDLTCTISKPYITLNYDSMDHLFSQLLDIINDKLVNKVVVGIPYNPASVAFIKNQEGFLSKTS